MTAETVYGLLRTQAKLSPSNIAIFAPARDPLTTLAYAAMWSKSSGC